MLELYGRNVLAKHRKHAARRLPSVWMGHLLVDSRGHVDYLLPQVSGRNLSHLVREDEVGGLYQVPCRFVVQ